MRTENIAARAVRLFESRQIIVGDFAERAALFEVVGDRERLAGEDDAFDILPPSLMNSSVATPWV